MELTEAQSERIAPSLPGQRGNGPVSNLHVLNAIRYVAEQGCKWRGVPARFGPWHTLDTRRNRWAKTGVLDRVFAHLQKEQLVRVKLEAGSLDSPSVKVHPDGTGARPALTFSRSPGQAHTAPEGRKRLRRLGGQREKRPVLMDRAYEGNATRQLALTLGFEPVVPPHKTRRDPWASDRELYKRRNEVERRFRRLKGVRRIFSRFEKLDVFFLDFLVLALIFDALR